MKNRTYIALLDKNANVLKKTICDKSLEKIADYLGIEHPLDNGDVIVVEREEL